jgi:hypothetical protein
MAQAEYVSNAIRALITGASAKPSTNRIRAAYAEFVASLAGHAPRLIPADPDAVDLEDRADHFEHVLSAVSVYLAVILEDTAQNSLGGLDLVHIEAVLSDLASEVTGTIRRAADSMTGRIA